MQNLHTFGVFDSERVLHSAWYTNFVELAEYARTQFIFETLALDCDNSNDPTEDNDEIYYEEPNLSGGIEGVDYGIIYGTTNEELEAEA